MTEQGASGSQRRTALVTGASRGVGKGVAIALAEAGFDVAIAARTVAPGESREKSTTVKTSDTRPLPGSLQETAAAIEAAGQQALQVKVDLQNLDSVEKAAEQVLAQWGHLDVLVNNAFYVGPGLMDVTLDSPLQTFQDQITVNALAPLTLIKKVLPTMIDRNAGTIINVTSGAGWDDPPAKAGEGGWGLGYSMSKAALHRIAGVLKHEIDADKVRVFNVHPGYVVTERVKEDMAEFGFDATGGAPPAVMGAVVAWIAQDPIAAGNTGDLFESQEVCHRLGLLPGWEPAPYPGS